MGRSGLLNCLLPCCLHCCQLATRFPAAWVCAGKLTTIQPACETIGTPCSEQIAGVGECFSLVFCNLFHWQLQQPVLIMQNKCHLTATVSKEPMCKHTHTQTHTHTHPTQLPTLAPKAAALAACSRIRRTHPPDHCNAGHGLRRTLARKMPLFPAKPAPACIKPKLCHKNLCFLVR